jgi:hypothetical protein
MLDARCHHRDDGLADGETIREGGDESVLS